MKTIGLFIVTLFMLPACFSVAGDSASQTDITPAVTPTPEIKKTRTNEVVPILELNLGGLIGGSQNGKWLSAKDVASRLKGGEKYELFESKKTNKTTITGGAPISEVPCEDFYYVEVEGGREMEGIAFGSALDWKPVPRSVEELDADSAVYNKIIGEVLASKGLAKSAPKATRIIKTDLDGDGTDEVIISATSFKRGVTSRGDVGDYSFILLRKIVNGKAKNFVLAGDFIKNIKNAGAPAEYKISGTADLNGDGVMEIIVFASYYEGSWVEVFEPDKNGASSVEVLKTGCGV